MRLRVRFAETDQMGVAHHSAFVVWMEAARVEWLRERGIRYRDIEADGISLAVSNLSLAYRAAAHFDDEIDIATDLVEARSRRFRFRYRLERVEDGALLALGETTHTPTDRNGRAVRLPATWLAKLEAQLATPTAAVVAAPRGTTPGERYNSDQ